MQQGLAQRDLNGSGVRWGPHGPGNNDTVRSSTVLSGDWSIDRA